MSITELHQLAKEIESQIKKTENAAKQKAREDIQKIAESVGLPLRDLIGTQSSSSQKPVKAVPAKYQNPKDSSQKWSGRGRQPTWVKDHLEKGGAMDAMLIA